jgi:DNA-binding MarR family transcriptional regulator
MPRKRAVEARAGSELAEAFELMMQQLLLLGHTLPDSATSLTPQQLKILFTLDFLGTPTPMSKVSGRLGVTPGTLTKVAAGLVRTAYVRRERSPEDDRVVTLSLANEGRRVVEEIKEYRRAFFAELCEGLSPSARLKLIESHRHIHETYRRILQQQRADDLRVRAERRMRSGSVNGPHRQR